ncbi:coproporphyrinogen III oxidase [Bacillaceae bacterium Marseille-Q3522]|nr:coproporphyrinogen III oxidase [Bacillaceae bacterium Marseille-Q3522]
MHIYIEGLNDDRLKRNFQLIGNLFFEEATVSFEKQQNNGLAITFSLLQDKGIYVKGKLVDENQDTYFAESAYSDAGVPPEKERKNILSRVYLDLLQQATDITQKWGILTGVRPTKLVHFDREKNIPKETSQQSLLKKYLISDEKIQLMEEIVDRQLRVVPDLYHLHNEVSIYIGIPFCPTKCAYCTFPAYAIGPARKAVSPFLAGLHYEMAKIGAWLKRNNVNITTVYFGGGTPTSITAEEMDALYEHMYCSFPNTANIREITVEAGRPDTITEEKLAVLKKWNINRISINPQSYQEETLKAIGRHHSVQETIDKFHLARAMGMNNINMDLIIGLPGEGVNELAHSLNETEKLMPESVTIHTLSFKRASEMTKNKSKYRVAARDEAEKMMEMAKKWTRSHGYVPYYLYRQKNILGNLENIGYALPGQESIYNIMIMEEKQTIIGIGCGAASKFIDPVSKKITQFSNPKDPKFYNDGFKEYTDKKIAILDELINPKNTIAK